MQSRDRLNLAKTCKVGTRLKLQKLARKEVSLNCKNLQSGDRLNLAKTCKVGTRLKLQKLARKEVSLNCKNLQDGDRSEQGVSSMFKFLDEKECPQRPTMVLTYQFLPCKGEVLQGYLCFRLDCSCFPKMRLAYEVGQLQYCLMYVHSNYLFRL